MPLTKSRKHISPYLTHLTHLTYLTCLTPLSLLLASSITSPAAPAPSPSRFIQDRIAIGFWVDPPADDHMDEHYADIAKANFTFVIGIFGAATPTNVARQLAYCDKYGLKAIVSQAGLPTDNLPTNSSCWGYFLADEPGAGAFAGLHQEVEAIHKTRPGRLSFINLLPNYVSTQAIGMTYSNYVHRFMTETQPDVLSMDHYPHFLPNADGRELYCENLAIMRAESLPANIPFWNFFNTMPFGDHSDPTEAQLRWQIYTSLAYGAKGFMYFCYWTPGGDEFPKGGAIITREGKKTRHYEEATRINGAIKNLGPTLMKLTSVDVIRITPKSDLKAVLTNSPITSITPGEYLIGVFKHADGRRAVLLNNYQFAYSEWPTVTFDCDTSKVTEVNPADGKEKPVEDDSPAMPGFQVSLDAGQGRLFLLPTTK